MIRYPKKHEKVYFEYIDYGDFFLYDGILYLKVVCHSLKLGGAVNALNFETMTLEHFENETVVETINCVVKDVE